MFETSLLLIKIFSFMTWESICYFSGRKRIECIKHIATYLTNINIIYSKIFQSLSAGTYLLSIEEMKYLSQFNDEVPYDINDIYNIDNIINELNNKCNSDLKLINNTPKKAGMIALIYYGTLNEKNVVIKIKRKNIEQKLMDALEKMSNIVNIISYIPLLNRLYLSKIYQENRNDMIKQIDFLNEVNNLKLYKKNFKNIDYVDIPDVYDIFTNNDSRIIVMEQLYGKRLNRHKHTVTDK